MRQHPFGQTGGAARIGKRNEIFFGIDCDFGRVAVAAQQSRKRLEASGLAKDKKIFYSRSRSRGTSLIGALGRGYEKGRPCIFELVSNFRFGVERIDRRVYAAEHCDRVKYDCVLRNI